MRILKRTDKYLVIAEENEKFVFSTDKIFLGHDRNERQISGFVMFYNLKSNELFVLDEYLKFFKGSVTVFKDFLGAKKALVVVKPLRYFKRIRLIALPYAG